jgi:hypothetical protein
LGFDGGAVENGWWTWVRIGTVTRGGCRRVCWNWVLMVVRWRMGGGLGLGYGLLLGVDVGGCIGIGFLELR